MKKRIQSLDGFIKENNMMNIILSGNMNFKIK